VYYAFKFNNFYIFKEELIQTTEKINLKDIPKAEKNIKMIFSGVHGYSFIFENEANLKILKKIFQKTLNIEAQKVISKIENVIEETKKIVPSTNLGIYAIIYFVCNEYYPFRVKIEIDKQEIFVTYTLLNRLIEPFSSATVRKITDQLKFISF
jgi:hypothetical protein